jgi:hypothetical protein
VVATSLRFAPVILAIALLSSCLAADLTQRPVAIKAPQHDAFTISGNLDVPLSPGTGGPLDLTLTNPYGEYMVVTGLLTAVTAVDAPEAGGARPCSAEDFAVDQFDGQYPIGVPAASTKSLSELGVPGTHMPALRMLNTALNQDGCKNATLTLTYTGTAEEPH